jgi:hypothetical protein
MTLLIHRVARYSNDRKRREQAKHSLTGSGRIFGNPEVL